MFSKILVLIVSAVVCCESAFVDTLTKCPKDDGNCQGKMIQRVIHDNPNGIPDLGMGSIDPAKLKNVNINIFNVVNMTLTDGEATGAKDCIVNKFSTDYDKRESKLDITCSITVIGQYTMFSDSPLVKEFLGEETIHGNGTGKVELDGLHLIMTLPFKYVKSGDDIFLVGKKGKFPYTYDVLGKVKFAANNLYLGKKESSKSIMKLMNENWKALMSSFGTQFLDVATVFISKFLHKFFSKVPCKHYFIEDLSSYVKN